METLRSFIVNRRGILYNQNKWQIPAVHSAASGGFKNYKIGRVKGERG